MSTKAGRKPAHNALSGGDATQTIGRQCLCNGLTATIGLGQSRGGGVKEPPLVTSGDALLSLNRFLSGRESYGAADVLEYLLGGAKRDHHGMP